MLPNLTSEVIGVCGRWSSGRKSGRIGESIWKVPCRTLFELPHCKYQGICVVSVITCYESCGDGRAIKDAAVMDNAVVFVDNICTPLLPSAAADTQVRRIALDKHVG